MSAGPVDLVLSRLENPREVAPGRWRACCPAHGGSNPSALSVGEGDNGAVLLRCWQGCTLESITTALGLDICDLFPPKLAGSSPIKRRRLLTASQALDVLETEMVLAQVCSADMAQGIALTDDTRARLLQGVARLVMLRNEVTA